MLAEVLGGRESRAPGPDDEEPIAPITWERVGHGNTSVTR